MERIIVRLDLSPETADTLQRIVESAQHKVAEDLTLDPPVHTRKALEDIAGHLETARAGLALACANPLQVDDDGVPVEL